MKKLFIYYTHSGNGELVKDYFLNKNYEIRRVIPKRELPKSFFLKIQVIYQLHLKHLKDEHLLNNHESPFLSIFQLKHHLYY